MRPSILVRHQGRAILVDTTPELRMQCLAHDVRQVDAVMFTHSHADHIMGMDDLRRFSDLSGNDVPVYADHEVCDSIHRIFPYIFRETQVGGGKPRIDLHLVEPEFSLFGLDIRAFYVLHGRLPVVAYRFDQPKTSTSPARSIAYVTDVSHIPAESMEQLHNLDILILDAVRFEPHVTHFGVHQAVEIIERLKPRAAYLTHLSHRLDHDRVNAVLPPPIQLAYDGLSLSL